MLSALSSPPPGTSMKDQQHAYLPKRDSVVDPLPENRLCPGCKKSAVSENGGLVVAFGQSFFHVDCFKCAKCDNQVTADTNLLLLSDGSPICANCSYSCNVCRLPILDEAIMTGDDSYHAHCFKCKVCKNRIDELVFAKTSQGIYCMSCHSDRMAKIRRHAQKKAERAEKEKEKERSSAAAKSRANDTPSPSFGFSNAAPSPTMSSHVGSADPTSQNHPRSKNNVTRTLSKRKSIPHISDALSPPPSARVESLANPRDTQPSAPSRSGSKFNKQFMEPLTAPIRDEKNRLLSPVSEPEGLKRRKSFDDGIRPLNLLLPHANPSSHASDNLGGGLDIPIAGTSRANKRRSVMPGTFDVDPMVSGSPPNTTPPSPSQSQAQTPGRESPRIRSPLASQFPDSPMSRRSNSPEPSSAYIVHTPTTSSSPHWTSESVSRSRSGSASTYTPERDERSKAPPARIATLDIVPPRSTSLSVVVDNGPSARPAEEERVGTSNRWPQRTASLSKGHGAVTQRSGDGRLSPADHERSFSKSSLDAVLSRSNSTSRSRPTSPARRADVPRNVESGTDTEAENEVVVKSPEDDKQPPESSESAENSDVEDVSPAEERMSHATFIAPALPPIRFSMNGHDFSELLGGVNAPSAKSLDQLAQLSEHGEDFSQPNLSLPPEITPGRSTPSNSPPESTVWSASSGALSSLPRGKAPNQEGHHGHVANTSLVLVSNHHTLPKRSHTVSSRHPAKYESPTSLQDTKRANDTDARGRASSESSGFSDPAPQGSSKSHGVDRITVTGPDSIGVKELGADAIEQVKRRIQEILTDANERGNPQLKLDKGLMELVLAVVERRNSEFNALRREFDGMKRASKQYIDGLTVAQTEYDQELKARRDAEAEVTRLRVLLSGQAARLTAISGENTRQEQRQQMSKELSDILGQLQQDIAKLRVERDMTLAELEELTSTKNSARSNSTEIAGVQLGRSLTMRLDNIKGQYQNELLPLQQQREALSREVAELKSVRDVFLEETTVLNARNEELAKLSALYIRRIDTAKTEQPRQPVTPPPKQSTSFDRPRQQQQHPLTAMLYSAANSSTTLSEDSQDSKAKGQKTEQEPTGKHKLLKWPGSKAKETAAKEALSSASSLTLTDSGRARPYKEHPFQHMSVLRLTRCDHCGEKMWGSQLRCTSCSMSVHLRCSNHVNLLCSPNTGRKDDSGPLPPSMFGRDLSEQVRADAHGGERKIPIIVEKCIEAVEASAMDYEGIYRKTGGSGQSKAITQLFERGDYATFDLRDSNRFPDICSITSVLKTYFRSLPVPLLTYDLHDNFIAAAEIKDPATKAKHLSELVKKLPSEHYYTLRTLMLHLSRVRDQSETNLMNARNLGVVFGPTLMRSPDPSAEFSDMAGKALSIEWLIENATAIFGSSH